MICLSYHDICIYILYRNIHISCEARHGDKEIVSTRKGLQQVFSSCWPTVAGSVQDYMNICEAYLGWRSLVSNYESFFSHLSMLAVRAIDS
jgi:hypothetical protein